ncbi:MAG: CHAT domain-containing protein [Gloeotrichia echinulata DEX184]|nr:CHAT domain-containing protein [Gloeotrichia echinulata DEX184]
MARKRTLFLSQLSTILKKAKYLFLGLVLTLVVVLDHGVILAAKPNLETAETLTQQGFLQLYQGQANAALKTWRGAYQAYQELNYQPGMTGSLINQSLAFQALGSYINACQILTQALSLKSWICPNSLHQEATSNKLLSDFKLILQKQPREILQITGFHNLANVLRIMGEPEKSYAIIKHCLALIPQLKADSRLENQLLLNLANTEFTLYNQAKSKYQLTDEPISHNKALILAKSKFISAQEIYQKLSLEKNEISLKASLNWLNLLLNIKSSNFYPDFTLNKSISVIINSLLTKFNQVEKLPIIECIYYKLNFSRNLIKISQDNNFINLSPYNLQSIALSLSQEALINAQKLNNQRAISYALGTLGHIYTVSKELLKAEDYFYNAMSFAQAVQAWDIAYEWQWELGRLYRLSRKLEQANQFYAAAINNLDKTDNDVLLINSNIQFAFKEKVEPLYHEYIDLLLTQDNFNKTYLKKAVEIQEQLNFAEVENFLQCGKFAEASLNSNFQHKLKDLPAIIYLIKLADRVEVVVKTPQEIYRHTVNFSLVSEPLNNLFNIIQSQEFVDTKSLNFFIYSQTIYQLLFEPIKQYLPQSGNLGFVLDSYFQNLPINMLYDGNQYLIEAYNVSIGSSAKQLRQSLLERAKTLVSGVSQIGPSFNNIIVPKNLRPLPQVKIEIENIKKNNPSALTLIDAEFTRDKFQQNVEDNYFSIIHLSTHAQFSSDLEQTFILAWDTPINVQDLKILVQNKSSLDLLVLSACQTAKGDRRSFLGIAGIAAQAGARGILASLWLVDAESTTQLMSKFYDGLKHGLTKAEALQVAQLSLLKSDKYFHPYYWSGFILVGG